MTPGKISGMKAELDEFLGKRPRGGFRGRSRVQSQPEVVYEEGRSFMRKMENWIFQAGELEIGRLQKLISARMNQIRHGGR